MQGSSGGVLWEKQIKYFKKVFSYLVFSYLEGKCKSGYLFEAGLED